MCVQVYEEAIGTVARATSGDHPTRIIANSARDVLNTLTITVTFYTPASEA